MGDTFSSLSNIKKELLEKVTILKESSFYKTKPVGPLQPDYTNQVIQIETELDPYDLIDFMLDCEKRCGRLRTSEKNQPRVIDCDLLMYGNKVINSENLILPHPRISERAFVIVPLLEIAGMDNEEISWALGVMKVQG